MNCRLRDVGGLVRPGMSLAKRAVVKRQPHLIYLQYVILETAHHSDNAPNSAQRTAAEEPRAFACSRIQMQQTRSKPVKRHRPFLRSQSVCSSKSSKRLLGPLDLLYNAPWRSSAVDSSSSIDSLRYQHTAFTDSTKLTCHSDRLSGHYSFTSQGSSKQ
jgi:hypothetical protein